MSVVLELGDASTRTIDRARTGLPQVTFERAMVRPAYGTTVALAGDGLRQHEFVDIAFEVHESTISASATTMDAVLTDCLDAALITTEFGVWEVLGVQSIVKTPVENGYSVKVRFLAFAARAKDDSGVLRLISGEIWELR